MKKLLSTILIVTLLFALSSSAMAAEYTDSGTSDCTVTAEIGSTYYVTVPVSLSLSYDEESGNHKASYEVGAKGNIAGNKKIVVRPTATEVTLTGETTGHTVTAFISQAKDTYVSVNPVNGEIELDHDEYVMTSGTVYTNVSQADSYAGTFSFEFSLLDRD